MSGLGHTSGYGTGVVVEHLQPYDKQRAASYERVYSAADRNPATLDIARRKTLHARRAQWPAWDHYRAPSYELAAEGEA